MKKENKRIPGDELELESSVVGLIKLMCIGRGGVPETAVRTEDIDSTEDPTGFG